MFGLMIGAGLVLGSLQARPLQIASKIDDKSWTRATSISPLLNQDVQLRIPKRENAEIRWYQIIPDLDTLYKNANHPWEEDPYKWVGFGKISYEKVELESLRNQWDVKPLEAIATEEVSRFYSSEAGSFWFQAEVQVGDRVYRSPGLEQTDYRGLSPRVFRVSVRENDGFIGYLSAYFNVPGLFGSVVYQSKNFIGVDCADVLVAAQHQWKGKRIRKNYNVAMLVNTMKRVKKIGIQGGVPDEKLRWGEDFQRGDIIAVKYAGARKYQHIGALYRDLGEKGVLDERDLVIHAGPHPLHLAPLKHGGFDGEVVILRP